MPVQMKLSPWQAEFLNRFDDDLLICMTGIGAGKTRAAAIWLVLQCARKPDSRFIAIAQNYKQLSRVLVRDIMLVATEMGLHVFHNKSEMTIKFHDTGAEVFCYSGDSPTGILGLSEIDGAVFDEAAFLDESVYNYAMDRCRGGKYPVVVRLISSPQNTMASQWFVNLVRNNPDKVIRASSFDNKFTSDAYKEELKKRYVEGSNLYRQQVLGEILDTDVASQIIRRTDFIAERDTSVVRPRGHWLGADFSGGVGCDSDVFTIIDSYGVVEYTSDNELNTQQKVAGLQLLYSKYSPDGSGLDVTGGYGNGAKDLGTEKGMKLTGYNFGADAIDKERYPNMRTEGYMELAESIRGGFWVPEEAKPELLAQQAYIDKKGRISLIPKELVKKMLGGKSPDLADSIMLAHYAMKHGQAPVAGDVSAEKAQEIASRYMAMFRANY